MKEKIRNFFIGRNGMDSLSVTLSWTAIILMIVSWVIPVDWLQTLIYYLALFCLIYAYFRVFSKDIGRRQSENAAFLTKKNQLKQRWTQRKTHKFFRCPRCKTVLRVPRGKGKVNITCRSCGEKFIRNT